MLKLNLLAILMNVIPTVYLITGSNYSSQQLDKLHNAARKVGIHLNVLPRSETLTSTGEFTSYNHTNPTFAVIDSETISSKAVKQIAKSQLESAVNQSISKALVYYPSIILIASSINVLDDKFSDCKEMMVPTNSFEEAVKQIAQIVHLRENKK